MSLSDASHLDFQNHSERAQVWCMVLIGKDDDEVTFNLKQVAGISQTPQSLITHAETSPSIYQPSEGFTTPSGENNKPCSSSREKLNPFLTSRDISPIRYSMIMPWDEAAERTKRFHTGKARQVVIAALEEIAPQSFNLRAYIMRLTWR
ncbi:hypothetical protein pdam_00017735 [Pocillopora damicornis]|uniref:Uncharacterized protein n=1 Tax=Pocillopora damicornis TaxID=46731 RepID=A0A3M6UD12_POCDA|nr:hypothetical protein pdam_00017735 [Pocillopora damicornis]